MGLSRNNDAVSKVAFRIAAVWFCLSLAVICASIATRTPWCDEGTYADPAASLATRGTLGSTVLGEHTVIHLPEVHKYTYWIPPFYPAALAAVFKLFGVGIFPMRAFSLVCALLALAAWYVVGTRLAKSQAVGLLASAVVALDFVFIQISANGRPDAMVLGCGLAGLAAYLTLRERNVTQALLAGCTLCALSAYTHPTGVMFVCDLVLLIAIFDRKRLRPIHALYAVLPCVLIGLLWLRYIFEAPEVFRAQFGTQIGFHSADRLSRATAVITDLYHRYFQPYYGELRGLHRLKILGLLFYVAAFLGLLLSPRLRARPAGRTALALAVANYLVLAVADQRHYAHYLVGVFAPVALACAIWIADKFETRSAGRWVAVSLLAVSGAVSVGGHGVKILANGYGNEFLPVIAQIKPITDRGGNVVAGAEIAFGVGFRPNVIDDSRLGTDLPSPPEAIVLDRYNLLESARDRRPFLATYQRVFVSRSFALYKPRDRQK